MTKEEEDYGDYVTRCICGFTHDDGYMICCDQCSVWQHVECMKVNPKNLPDKYLCEQCEPRAVDKKKARLVQMKKKEDMSDFDEEDSSSERGHSASPSGGNSPHSPSIKKRKKAHRTSSGGTLRVHELKAEARRNRKEKGDKDEGKKGMKKKSKHHQTPQHQGTPPPPHSIMSGLQTLLTAASALEEQQQRNSQMSEQVSSNSMFNCTASPWRDPYKTIDSNQYTDALREGLKDHLAQLKNEAVVYSKEEYAGLGPFPLCLVRDVGSCRKGLVSEAHIPEDEMILEYKGRITLKDALCQEMDLPHQLLWKHKPCPFVFQYERMSSLWVCLDARHYGNTARFIRRSCNPNAEVRHFFVDDDVHFGVYATNHISPEDEVTLPFDFPRDKCDYPVECACKRHGSCLVANKSVKPKKIKKELKNEVVDQQEGVVESGDVPIGKKTSVKGRLFPAADEDSNSSWTSTGSNFSRKRFKRTCSQSSVSQQNSRDPTDSESEDLDGDGSKKRKSREERKTEAVWKMFEKMEATRRKKLSSVSESNLEETARSSPGYGTPRSEIKERRTSTNSRKVQLLPSGKHRLSSLSSSVDLLSPEHPDAFSSPPLTPSLSFTLHHQSHDLLHQTDSTSSLIPPPFATLPKLSFEVTPYLHPKYLLADFALPRKKAILRQWEMEQREMTMDDNGDNGQWMANGFALACMKAMEGYKPRQRGCLKHRWMDMHSKELQDETEMFLKLPHKKRFLQKWLESSTETQPTSTPIANLTPPPSSSSSPSLSGSISDNKTDLSEPTSIPTVSDTEDKLFPDHTSKPHPPPPPGDTSVPSSPLFDDFSDDDDFEDISEQHDRAGSGEKREKAHKQRKDIRNSDMIDSKPVGCHDDHSVGGVKPPNESTTVSSEEEDVAAVAQDPSSSVTPDGEPGKVSAETTTTTSSELMETGPPQDRESAIPKLEIPSQEKEASVQRKMETEITVEEISGEEDNPESVEMDISSSPLPPVSATDEQEMASTGRDKSGLDSSIDSMEKSLFLSPFNDNSSKPGSGKRKMSLLEYRSRARKPSEHMQRRPPSQDTSLLSSIVTTPTPPPPSTNISAPPTNPSPSHSFLSYSSSFLSGSSNRMVNPPLGGVGSSPTTATRLFDTGPQFEPVSPDEDDRTQLADEAPLKRPSSLTTLPPPPPPPPPPLPSTNQPSSSMPYNVSHTPTNIMPPGQQLMWGGHPPANPMDMSQDPRRVHQPPGPNPDMFIHHPPPVHQTPMSPQELIRPHYLPPQPVPSVPYSPMMHPQQIRTPMGGDYVPCGPHTPVGSGGGNVFVQPHPRMPHPSLLHQAPPPHHPNSNYYQ